MRVLVVDDQASQRRSLAAALRLEGCEVEEAGDGHAALALVESLASAQRPDFAIVDLMMPGMSGLDLARRLKLTSPDTRVVLTSAYHLSESQIRRSDAGIAAFLPKPFEIEELLRYLEERHQRAS